MDYRYIKAFTLTAKYNSFSKAAEELKIAQSAVSRQIKLLEESVGEVLIIRSSKKVLLTDKGTELFMAAKNFDELTSDIFAKEGNKLIRLGVLDGLVENWLISLLSKYYKKYANNIKIFIDTPNVLKEMLANGQLDIISTTENIQSDLISSLKLFNERMVLISKTPISISQAHEHRWITFSENDPIFSVFKKKSKKILTVDSMSATVNLVKQNIGIAVIPAHVLKNTDNLEITPLKISNKSEIYMSTLNYKTMPKYLKNFISIVQTMLKK